MRSSTTLPNSGVFIFIFIRVRYLKVANIYLCSQGTIVDAAYLAQSRVPQILFGTIFPAVVATICVLGRFYSRGVLLKCWGLDDTLLLIAWVSLLVTSLHHFISTDRISCQAA